MVLPYVNKWPRRAKQNLKGELKRGSMMTNSIDRSIGTTIMGREEEGLRYETLKEM